MNIKIIQIDHNSKYLKDVIKLGDANKNTLGLFPSHESFQIIVIGCGMTISLNLTLFGI